MKKYNKSEAHHQEACRYLAGGVGSDARLTPDKNPICFERGLGSRIFDIDGNEYIDYFCALGPLILGHCPPKVVQALKKQVELGSIFGFDILPFPVYLSESNLLFLLLKNQ